MCSRGGISSSPARQVLAFVRVRITQLLRNRAELIALIVAPLVITTVLGAVGWNNPEEELPVAFVDEDHTALSTEARALLADEPWLDVDDMDRDRARDALDEGRTIRMVVIVPDGFQAAVHAGRQTSLEVVRDREFAATLAGLRAVDRIVARIAVSAASARAVEALVASVAPTVALDASSLYERAQMEWDSPPVDVAVKKLSASSVRSDAVDATGNNQSSLGWTTVFMLFVGLSNAAAFVEEREAGTLARLGAMPTTRARVVLGKAGGAFATSIIEAALLVSFGALALGVSWGRNPLAVGLLLTAFAVFTSGAAILLGTLVRSRGEATAGVWAVTFTIGILGGSLFSIEMMSQGMRRFAHFMPTQWMMEGLVDVIVRNQGLSEALLPSAMLMSLGAVLLVAAAYRLRFS